MEWIEVKKQHPLMTQNVLATDGEIIFITYLDYCPIDKKNYWAHLETYDEITHWMPLPLSIYSALPDVPKDE